MNKRSTSFTPALPCAAFFLAAVFLVGCAASDGTQRERHNPNRITSVQVATFLETNSGATAHDIVWQMRPNWLTRRQVDTVVWLYEGGMRVGEASEELGRVDLNHVQMLEYMSPTDATSRFGPGHEEGVIILTYRRGGG
jgi:hypothetical protein